MVSSSGHSVRDGVVATLLAGDQRGAIECRVPGYIDRIEEQISCNSYCLIVAIDL